MYTILQGTSGSDGGPARQEKEPFKQEMSENAIAAKKSLDVCIELYKKNVWYVDCCVSLLQLAVKISADGANMVKQE